jgi:hypothetical protein
MATRPSRSHRVACAILAAGLLLSPARAAAETFQDDFGLGLRPAYWRVHVSDGIPRYTVAAVGGELRIRKPVDPAPRGVQSVGIEFPCPVLGDFRADIQYHDAMITRHTGSPGNSLRLTARFPGLTVSTMRASEANAVPENFHAWVDPPAFAYTRTATNVIAGLLRIERQGFIVRAWCDGTLVWSGYATDDTLLSVALEVVNDGTTDSVAVTFDDFALTADAILFDAQTLDAPAVPAPAWSVSAAPNPASGPVHLAFDLPAADEVRARVVDLQGRTIATLHDGPMPAGRRDLVWEPWRSGSVTTPGVYLLVAEWRGRRLMRKLALCR